MASVIYLDTHVVSWLYAGRKDLLSARVHASLEERDILISPMVRLELQYLYEIGRTRTPAAKVVQELSAIGLKLCGHPFTKVIERAERQSWTRDWPAFSHSHPFRSLSKSLLRILRSRHWHILVWHPVSHGS